MQPLQPVSIKLVKSMLRIRFMNAFNVLADLSAVASFPHHSSSNPSVCVGFLYTVVRSSLLSRRTKQSRKGSFPFSSISLVNWMSAFCSLRWS